MEAGISIRDFLDKKWYPDFQDTWDAHEFRRRILDNVNANMRLLDIGAGRGATPFMSFKDHVKYVVGTDIDEAVLENQKVDKAVHTPDGSLKGVEDASIDIVVCKDVLEHVATPEKFFSEISRVLKPGGIFMGKTPGGGHYVPFFARITPMWFHVSFNKMRGRDVVDTFPTTYLCNSRKQLSKWAELSKLDLTDLSFQEGRPEYLRFNPITYFVGFLYERTVNALKLNRFKAVIYVTMTKPIS